MTVFTHDPTPPTYLLDTNILLCLMRPSHRQHEIVREAVHNLRQHGAKLVTVPQSIYEVWAVMTRTTESDEGAGYSEKVTFRAIMELIRLYPPQNENANEIFSYWGFIVQRNDIKGSQTHDARMVAAMHASNITHILTLNTSDYANFIVTEKITVVDPAAVPQPVKEHG